MHVYGHLCVIITLGSSGFELEKKLVNIASLPFVIHVYMKTYTVNNGTILLMFLCHHIYLLPPLKLAREVRERKSKTIGEGKLGRGRARRLARAS